MDNPVYDPFKVLRQSIAEAKKLYEEGTLTLDDILWGWSETVDMLERAFNRQTDVDKLTKKLEELLKEE